MLADESAAFRSFPQSSANMILTCNLNVCVVKQLIWSNVHCFKTMIPTLECENNTYIFAGSSDVSSQKIKHLETGSSVVSTQKLEHLNVGSSGVSTQKL